MAFSDLPPELESEILSRVPSLSIAKLRSTCKRWYILYKEERFLEKNLSKAIATPQVILKENHSVYSVSINLNDPSIDFTGKLNSFKDSEHVEISEIFHCDGLLLCTTKDQRLVVWNPCTGQTRWIQPVNRYTMYENYVLGYEDNNKSLDNYKILRSSYRYSNKHIYNLEADGFEIYEFNSDSWRALDDVTWIWDMLTFCPGLSLKGNTYWFAWDDVNSSRCLIRFDFKKERFELLSLPSHDDNGIIYDVKLSVIRQEKLAVLCCLNTWETKIWVSDDKISEAKNTKIQYSLLVDFGNIGNGITTLMYVKSFVVDEENKMVACCRINLENDEDNTVIDIIGSHDCKILVCEQRHGRGLNDYSPSLISYVPSLVQIHQA